jgi:hypothetical protein
MAQNLFYGICENKSLQEIKAENIPGCASVNTYNVTIPTNWSSAAPYTQTVAVTGITSADAPIIDVVLDANSTTAASQLEAWACVSKIKTGTDIITVTCLEEKPLIEIPIQLKAVR